MSEQLSETTALYMDDMLGIPVHRGIRINSMLAIADTSARHKIEKDGVRTAEQVETDHIVEAAEQVLKTLEGVGLLSTIRGDKELLSRAEAVVEGNLEDYHQRHLEIREQLEIVNEDLAAHRIVFSAAKVAYEAALAQFQELDQRWQDTKTGVEYGLESVASTQHIQSKDEVSLLFQKIAAQLTDPQTVELAMNYKQATDEKNLKESIFNAATTKLALLEKQKTNELEKLRLFAADVQAEIPEHKRYAKRIGKSGSHIRQETLKTRSIRLIGGVALYITGKDTVEVSKHGAKALGEAQYAVEA